jgi:hypothetical protein
MPGDVAAVIKDNEIASKIINSDNRFNENGQLFIAELKGHIDEMYINDFINFPPIIRNLTF